MYTVKSPNNTTDFDTLEEADEYAKSLPLSLIYKNDTPQYGYTQDGKEDPKKVHAYDIGNILKPFGSHNQSSLSKILTDVFNQLIDIWTNTNFSDSLTREEVIIHLTHNARKELEEAIRRIK